MTALFVIVTEVITLMTALFVQVTNITALLEHQLELFVKRALATVLYKS